MNCLDEATVVSNLQIISADVARAVELWLAHEPKALPTAEEHNAETNSALFLDTQVGIRNS